MQTVVHSNVWKIALVVLKAEVNLLKNPEWNSTSCPQYLLQYSPDDLILANSHFPDYSHNRSIHNLSPLMAYVKLPFNSNPDFTQSCLIQTFTQLALQ